MLGGKAAAALQPEQKQPEVAALHFSFNRSLSPVTYPLHCPLRSLR